MLCVIISNYHVLPLQHLFLLVPVCEPPAVTVDHNSVKNIDATIIITFWFISRSLPLQHLFLLVPVCEPPAVTVDHNIVTRNPLGLCLVSIFF